MDKYSRSLARFLEMRVQIRLGTYTTVFGTLVEVNSEFLRLENSRIVDEYEESDWSSKITEGDPDRIAASSDGESLTVGRCQARMAFYGSGAISSVFYPQILRKTRKL
ncbi:MAG: hypothetical protein WCK15_20375 [Pirellula sp.]